MLRLLSWYCCCDRCLPSAFTVFCRGTAAVDHRTDNQPAEFINAAKVLPDWQAASYTPGAGWAAAAPRTWASPPAAKETLPVSSTRLVLVLMRNALSSVRFFLSAVRWFAGSLLAALLLVVRWFAVPCFAACCFTARASLFRGSLFRGSLLAVRVSLFAHRSIRASVCSH